MFSMVLNTIAGTNSPARPVAPVSSHLIENTLTCNAAC
jgi:hypothetical protein